MNIATHIGNFPAQQDPPNLDEIRLQLGRIVRSTIFSGSLRLTKFLSFVVEATVARRTGTIKAYTIAVEALGRASDFDPQTDPIVRVEAGRLRIALSRYYADAGRDDPIVIELPRGSYVPVFRRSAIGGPRQPERADIAKAPMVIRTNRSPQLVDGQRRTAQLHNAVTQKIRELQIEISTTHTALQDSFALLSRQSRHHLPLPFAPMAANNDAQLPAEEVEPAAVEAAQPQQPPSVPASVGAGARITAIAGRPRARPQILKFAGLAVGLLLLLEFLFDIDHPLHGGPNHGWFFKWPSAAHMASLPAQGEAAPIIYVEPPTALGERTATAISPQMIRDRLIDVLARFDDV